jgi:hypothetical protein
MRAQISTSVSAETRRKADALVAQAGHTYRELVSIGIDRLYAEWRDNMRSETIDTIEWHVNLPDLLDDDETTEGVHIEASQRRYVALVEAALHEAFPEAEIITRAHQATGWSRPVAVNGVEGHARAWEVDDVIATVYQGWQWLVMGDTDATHEAAGPTVLAAIMIRPYVGPQWLIEVHPNAEESDADDLAAINASEWGTLEDNLQGWGEYTSVIHVLDTDTYYLARLA